MEELLLWEFPLKVREWATLLFFWSGVAIWVGLAARFLIPAGIVRGPWLTLCLGFVGSCLGPFALRSFFDLDRFDPIGPCGLVASVGVATATLCLFYAVAFFFPSRLEDEDNEIDGGAGDGTRERAGNGARLLERRNAPRRRSEYERDRADGRDWERDARDEYEGREYAFAQNDWAKASDEEERERPSRPRRRE